MPESAGTKKFIKDFLQRVRGGEGFIEDIWIDRIVRLPGSTGEGSTAQSLSGRPINNITQLLEDDLRHSADDGYFTFRIVSALKGSGKTSLLTYLHELTKTKLIYRKLSVVSRFPLTNLASMGGGQNFNVNFYCYILAETFWKLITDSDPSVKNAAKGKLNDYLDQSEVNQLVTASSLGAFRSKFTKYFSNLSIVFEEFFFEVINEVSKVEPQYTFAYLIDEFDGLEKRPNDLQQALTLIRSLIKRAAQEFGLKIRLFIYLVGTSENIKSFFVEDPIIESLIGPQVVNLNAGYGNEFEMIRTRVDERIEGAFKGYKDFDKAWKEIKSISLSPGQTLRQFCQEYATAVLAIYERCFKEAPEQSFEGNARELVEAQCRQKWQSYLSQKAYTLSLVSTTTILEGHAFDCYVELLHNCSCVARCFGEAKNYELFISHLETFSQWLKDVGFKPFADGTPPDLAFMIAPASASLLQRKLEIKNIQFIQSSKVSSDELNSKQPENQKVGINVNTADKISLKIVFKGTRIQEKTIDKLISNRPYGSLDDLAVKMKLSDAAKNKLQTKISSNEIYFS